MKCNLLFARLNGVSDPGATIRTTSFDTNGTVAEANGVAASAAIVTETTCAKFVIEFVMDMMAFVRNPESAFTVKPKYEFPPTGAEWLYDME